MSDFPVEPDREKDYLGSMKRFVTNFENRSHFSHLEDGLRTIIQKIISPFATHQMCVKVKSVRSISPQ